MLFKCKMCGAQMEIREGMTVTECGYCGTQQTLPKTNNEQNLNMFNRANHFRQQCEFDKANEIYEKLAADAEKDAEVYWSIVLCRYGIEYVDDPATKKKIPTCHRTQFKSILEDPDYLTALECSDVIQRDVYEREAKYIDKVQKGILQISNKEKPFDVFICYKETDKAGRRTQDSVLAQDIYYGLQNEGFNVFFSRITLENKLGTEYEPYIFAALNSAKVMVVVGTKPEHFNAVWVHNEWSRYLMLMKNDKSRLLIPAYKDMDPYDLPDTLSMFQSQDMSKIGFLQDLIRGIKKIVAPEKEEKAFVQKAVVQTTSTNITPLLKRAYLFLEDRDWKSANEYAEKVLDQDPENPQAYIVKLLSELNVTTQSNLANQQQPFNNNKNFKNAIRFADEELKITLNGYINIINERNQNAILEGKYVEATNLMKNAKTSLDYGAAKVQFYKLGKYKDSESKAAECEKKELVFREKKMQSLYDDALNKLNSATSESICIEAKQTFATLGAFKDSMQRIQECEAKRREIIYNNAYRLMNSAVNVQQLNDAILQFMSIENYKDASKKMVECNAKKEEIIAKEPVYQKAMNAYKQGIKISYQQAEKLFDSIGDYKDSSVMADKCRQILGNSNINTKRKTKIAIIIAVIIIVLVILVNIFDKK